MSELIKPNNNRPEPACVGIDLAGVEHRESGIAILRGGRLIHLGSAWTDGEVFAAALRAGRRGVVAINAPLTRPAGRCCLDDDCPCRTDPGTRSRQLERDLGRLGIPTLATALIKVLARRGRRLSLALRLRGIDPLEVYPFATLRLLNIPAERKKTAEGRRAIHRGLRRHVPGLDHPTASEHQLDAVACALTAHLWRSGRARTIGDPGEGLMTIPSVDRRRRKGPARGRPAQKPVSPAPEPAIARPSRGAERSSTSRRSPST